MPLESTNPAMAELEAKLAATVDNAELAPVEDRGPRPELAIPSYIEPKADLIYGATGTGKTVNIGEVSDYILKKYGKLTRMASADGGGFGPLTGMVKSGQIEYWAINAWPRPIAAMHRAVQGYWPLRTDDPESPLVRPDAGTYAVYGFGAFEGLTSFSDTILRNLKEEKASLSQDPSFTFIQSIETVGGSIREDALSFSGGNMSYYGFLQDQLNWWVVLSHLLGYEKVNWTGLESKGDDSAGATVYGPMIGGRKATGKASQWFCNTFHMDVVEKTATLDAAVGSMPQEMDHVLFLKTHLDKLTRVPFPCKLRCPKAYAKEVPAYLTSGSVADAYRLLDRLYEKQRVESVGKMSEIANLKERLLENAAKARAAEQVAAEKRAKEAGLLKKQVTVPAGPTGAIAAVPTGPVGVVGSGAVPKPAKPAGALVPPAGTLPAVPPSIQAVRPAPAPAKKEGE